MRVTSILHVLGLVASVAAAPVEVLDRRDITPQQLSSLAFFAQYAGTSYCNSANVPGQAVTCGEFCPLVEADGAITSVGFATPILDTRGLIAIDPVRELIVVSFRGSTSIRNWLTDFTFVPVPCPPTLPLGCLVHVGFLAAWAEVSSVVLSGISSARLLYPSYSVISTGHSLGGAIATLAAAYLRESGIPTDLYTYGSPRVGNSIFTSYISEPPSGNAGGTEYRVTKTDDPVPKLPPLTTTYRHVSPEYWINSDEEEVEGEHVEVCEGYVNLACNSGTLTVNATAHLRYFGNISGCGYEEGFVFPPFRLV